MQQLNAWYAFKRHTVYLEDLSMRERLITFIESTTDPFAAEIRYHRSCWKNHVTDKLYSNNEENNLHLHNVSLSEVKEMFYHHVGTIVFEQHELRTLQSLLADYVRILQNFGLDGSAIKSSTIKNMLSAELHDHIGFYERPKKNKSVLVYDIQSVGSYVEAAINYCGVTDDQLLSLAAQRMKCHIDKSTLLSWPPHVDELVDDEKLNALVYQFVSMLRNTLRC